MTQTVESIFDEALERYKAGADAAELIPVFKDLCDRGGRAAPAYSSLAWLYLLTEQPQKALKAAQKGVKADKHAPQGQINLALALLDSGEKGVRKHIEKAQEMLSLSDELRNDVMENIKDGLERKPDWESLQRVQRWLFG